MSSGSHATRGYSDRAQFVDALERLARTGEPRHVTHDDGEELDAALKQALAAGADPEIQWLATRAAAPIVPTIGSPLSSRTRPVTLNVRAERVLTLPWPVEYVADVDARLDDGEWQPILRLKSGTTERRALNKLLPDAAAMRPGFHRLMLRARMRYSQLPAGMARRETRNLLTVHYGIYGQARAAADPVRPFFDAAASVSAATLDPNLPDVPFPSWLDQLPREDRNERPAIFWTAEWCGLHESMSEESLLRTEVCVVAHRSGPERTMAETWIRVGSLGSDDDDEPRWVRKEPTLVAAYICQRLARMRVPLNSVARYLSQPVDEWPSARLVANAAGISVAASTITPGVPTILRVLVANMGDVDAVGVTINVLAISEANLPSTHRAFVRTIRAGGSVEIETPVVFPTRYGFVDVLVAPSHDAVALRMDAAGLNQHAYAVINQRAAPAGYLQRLCLTGTAPGSCTH